MSENDEKKEYLNQYRNARMEIIRLDEQLRELRASRIIPAQRNDGMPHGAGGGDLSEYAAQVNEIEQDILSKRYRLIEVFDTIRRAIDRCSYEDDRLLLTYRYIRLMTWERIAVKMGYSWRQIIRLHGRALENFKIPK